MLELVKQLNDAKFDELFRFEIAGKHIGYVRPELAQKLIERAPDFLGQTGPQTLAVIAENLSPQQLTARFKTLHEELAAEGVLPKPAAEFTDVRARITDEPLCQINRNLIFPLGIISRGVHVILTHENGDFVVAKRSDTKVFTFQGAYDVPVGGLLPSGKDPWDYVKVEAAEEAGLGEKALKPDGEAIVLGYARNVQGQRQGAEYKPAFPFETDGGTNWDEVFYWTATIPDGVVPEPQDGEVKSFQRMSPAALIHSLRTEPQNWKTNSGVMFLEALARDPRYSNLFTADEHRDLKALLIADPRPPSTRGELASSPPKTAATKNPGI
jgi:hypothetical protein